MNPTPIAPFAIARLPRILFGQGVLDQLPAELAKLGRKALLVHGASLLRSPLWSGLEEAVAAAGVEWLQCGVSGEPSPEGVDAAVSAFRGQGIEVVVGIGGGSVMDAAKAIAALLPRGNSVLDHLEDVGRGLPYQGPPLPLVAVPTTAGTGSEATKNAVLSRHGAEGFKKSFRDERMVAELALVDPRLIAGAPAALIAAQGMDAFTQLLESYVSRRANPFTDALAWSGLEAVASGFVAAWQGGEGEVATLGRGCMAYGALLSGITLAQVGLGSVHGLAQPLGSFFPIPHGVACGSVLAEATQVNIEALRARAPESSALAKYARVGRLLAADAGLSAEEAHAALLRQLVAWREQMGIARLGHYGVASTDLPRIVAASRGNSMQSNPIVLSDAEVASIVAARL